MEILDLYYPPMLRVPALRLPKPPTFERNRIVCADVFDYLATIPDDTAHCAVSSYPYWGLRDYGVSGQLGNEPTLEEYLRNMVRVSREVRRVLRPDGIFWLNMGDCYATSPNGRSAADTRVLGKDDRSFRDKPYSTVGGIHKSKDLIAQSWRLALALQADGWWLRSAIPWFKLNPMPESVRDRPVVSNEYIFMLTKSERYWYDRVAVRQAAKVESIARSHRGNSDHKHKAGAPGQTAHSLAAPRPNRSAAHKRAGGGRLQTMHIPAPKQDASGLRRYVGLNARYEASELGTAERRVSWWHNESLSAYTETLRWLQAHPDDVDETLAELERYQESGITLDDEDMLLSIATSTSQMKAAHFATFPPRLIEPLILAGCPPHSCSLCGAPYIRITEKQFVPQDDVSPEKGIKGSGSQKPDYGGRDGTPRGRVVYSTLGWEAGCEHNAVPVPGLVLDPFMGSGTSALVALQHHRHYAGCELNAEYFKIAEKRLTKGLSPDDKDRIEKGRNLRLWA